jgi:hypothetical protein
MAPIETTRRAIYDLVWSKPMTKVAADLQISDVALKKACDRHRVPTPPRGHWAKKEAGKPIKQVNFVETADPQDERVVIYGNNHPELPESVKEIIDQHRIARTERAKSTFFVSASVQSPIVEVHKAVVATAKALRKAKPDKDDVVSAAGVGVYAIEVAAACVERVITILDGLARALETQGLALAVLGNAFTVTSGVDVVKFKLIEFVRREKHVPTVEELAKEERRRRRQGITWDSPYGRVYPEWNFIRTGELSVEIENQYLNGYRRSWKDGKRQRLEDVIEDISIGIITYAAGLKLDREASERRERNWERQSRVRARAEKRRNRENERSKILDELVGISTEAAKLRTWLAEAEKWPQPSQSNEFTKFVAWARTRLAYLEQAVEPGEIADALKSKQLFPEIDPLVDPSEDLIEEC